MCTWVRVDTVRRRRELPNTGGYPRRETQRARAGSARGSKRASKEHLRSAEIVQIFPGHALPSLSLSHSCLQNPLIHTVECMVSQ